MKTVIDKLRSIPFEQEKDKEVLEHYFNSIFQTLETDEDRETLIYILETEIDEMISFDTKVLGWLWTLLHALLSANFFGTKIDHQEYLRIYESLEDFELYKYGLLNDKKWIEETYWIIVRPINFDVERKSITASKLEETHFLVAIPLIKKLLSHYPPIYIYNIKLDWIFVAENFFKKNNWSDSTHLWWLKASTDNNIYLTFHAITQSFDHELYHQAMSHYNDVEERANLRSTDDYFYQYQQSHHDAHGFAINYWRENISEDQATVAEFLIKDYQKMMDRAEQDHILAKKVKLVMEAFEDLSEGFMNVEWLTNSR